MPLDLIQNFMNEIHYFIEQKPSECPGRLEADSGQF